MNEGTVRHDTVAVRRSYDATPERVFRAWSRREEIERWYMPGDERWSAQVTSCDFRVGGAKCVTFGPPEETYHEDCHYVDIVPNRRICYSMTIARGETPITVSMVTVELMSRAGGCDVLVTDQVAILDGGDTAKDREHGWGETLDRLTGFLARA